MLLCNPVGLNFFHLILSTLIPIGVPGWHSRVSHRLGSGADLRIVKSAQHEVGLRFFFPLSLPLPLVHAHSLSF